MEEPGVRRLALAMEKSLVVSAETH
jgi:hypothetical protein